MTFAEQCHADHKARLARMGEPPRYQAKLVVRSFSPPKPEPPLKPEAYYPQYWMWDLVQAQHGGREVTIRRIQNHICEACFVSLADMIAPGRGTSDLVHARHIAMYLCRQILGVSLPKIARSFGGRDHTTVIHAITRVGDKIAASHEYACEIARLEREILG